MLAATFIPLLVNWPLQLIQEAWAKRSAATQVVLDRQMKVRHFICVSSLYIADGCEKGPRVFGCSAIWSVAQHSLFLPPVHYRLLNHTL